MVTTDHRTEAWVGKGWTGGRREAVQVRGSERRGGGGPVEEVERKVFFFVSLRPPSLLWFGGARTRG